MLPATSDETPGWARALQGQFAAMQGQFAAMQRQLAGLRCDVDDIKIDMAAIKKDVRLAYCRPGMCDRLVGNTDACATLLACRGVKSMSVAEVVADFKVNERGRGVL